MGNKLCSQTWTALHSKIIVFYFEPRFLDEGPFATFFSLSRNRARERLAPTETLNRLPRSAEHTKL